MEFEIPNRTAGYFRYPSPVEFRYLFALYQMYTLLSVTHALSKNRPIHGGACPTDPSQFIFPIRALTQSQRDEAAKEQP
jgi:hypothetical protein